MLNWCCNKIGYRYNQPYDSERADTGWSKPEVDSSRDAPSVAAWIINLENVDDTVKRRV